MEDNYGGGLGSAIAELSAETRGARVWRMTVPRVPKSGRSGEEVLAWLGLDPKAIAERAKALAEILPETVPILCPGLFRQ